MCGPKCFKKVKGFFRRKKTHRLADVEDDSDVEEGGRERSVVFDVSDEGPGFDMARVDYDATDPEQLYAEDGRGIFLMRRLMDRVEQLRGPRHVVRLTLNR